MISIMIPVRAPTSLKAGSPDDGRIYLPNGFKPSEKDVVCGWAKQNHLHPGNKRFRRIVELSAPLYDAADTKQGKTRVIGSVVQRIRRESPGGGGFVKRNEVTGLWYEIGDDKARDKVGHAIRRLIEEKKKKNKWSALVNLVASIGSGNKKWPIAEKPSDSSAGDSSDAKPRSAKSQSEALLGMMTKMEPLPLLDTIISCTKERSKEPTESTAHADAKPPSRVLSMPNNMEPLPLLDTLHAAASLQQNQPHLLGKNAASLMGPANLGVYLRGSMQQNGVTQTNNNIMNINIYNQSIPSSPYIAETAGRILDIPHLLGRSAPSNRGSQRMQDMMMTNPIAGLPPRTSASQLPTGSSGTVYFHAGEDAAMEELLGNLNPTPIGPYATVASTSTNKKDGTETEKGTRTTAYNMSSTPRQF